ncbi:hypothetical protein C8F01DRAFT_1212187 [Mycena amicta]|nr:hypothetical protein C8F01DRAFT_1212187 [Mycena amicta]
MLFCPTCANLLVVGDSSGFNKWICQTCPYEFPISKQYTARTKSGDTRTFLVDSNHGSVECQKCGHGFAYFHQLQTRSADEPMTISCGTVRKEN